MQRAHVIQGTAKKSGLRLTVRVGGNCVGSQLGSEVAADRCACGQRHLKVVSVAPPPRMVSVQPLPSSSFGLRRLMETPLGNT